MKAPFNATADLVNGPGAAMPGVVRRTISCRFVRENGQIPQLDPLRSRVAYMTFSGDFVFQASTVQLGSVFITNYSVADRVAIPSGSPVQYVVAFTERVAWRGQPVYYRSHLVPVGTFPEGGVFGAGTGLMEGSALAAGGAEVPSGVDGFAVGSLAGSLLVASSGGGLPSVDGSGAALLAGVIVASSSGGVVSPVSGSCSALLSGDTEVSANG